ncbi:MAG: glycosyltransferase family 4 protein, partial [Bryobacterales bacterium]|nr:glycosyltransferase family 4 protein [Bryobacterales bacterium]
MRILLTTDAVGGVLTYTRELLGALLPAGSEFCVAVLGPVPAGAPLPARYEHHPGKLEWMENPWDDVGDAERWLEERIARYRPDVVHLNSYLAPRTDAPILLAAHSCVLSWWQAVKQEAAPESWHRYRTQVEKALDNAGRIVTPTHAMREALVQHYGAAHDIEVIANTRSPRAFTPNPKRPVIFTAGRLWDDAKNLGALAAVAPDLAWPVFAAGDSAAIHTENLRLLGRLEERQLAAWLGSSAIYALPALYEPFGLSVLEAGLAGCALVLGDIPSLRE